MVIDSEAGSDWVLSALQGLKTIHALFSIYSKQVSEATGLSVPQVLCLQAIREREPDEVTGAQIAVRIGMSHASVSRLLVELEGSRWVARKQGATDRRKYVLRLTANGRKKLEKLPSILKVRQGGRLTTLSKQEQAELTAHLDQVLALLRVSPEAADRLLGA